MPHRSAPRRLVLGLALVLVSALASACASSPPARPLLGQSVAFEAPRLDGPGTLTLDSLRGRVVLVDMWASWCVPCRGSLRAYDALRARLADRGFEVVAIGLDDERALAERFLAEVPVTFPVVWDEGHQIVARYPIDAMPTALVLDRQGVVRHVEKGFLADSEATLTRVIEELLAAPTP